jgi:hypothetical protein
LTTTAERRVTGPLSTDPTVPAGNGSTAGKTATNGSIQPSSPAPAAAAVATTPSGTAPSAVPIPVEDEPDTLQTDTLYARAVVLDGTDNAVVLTNTKTRAYTIGMNGDTSTISLAAADRQYRLIADGQNGNLWAANQVHTNRVAANVVDLDGPNNHLKAAHSKTRAYTVGINGDTSTISLANDQKQYRIIADGSKGDLWAHNQVATRRVSANIIDLEGPSNHIKFASSKTSVYTIGINGDDSQMAFANPDSAFYTVIVDGRNGDIVLTNADCAEDFDVDPDVVAAVEPGTVVTFDGEGRLRPCGEPYDRAAAGVISGAGRFRPAMVLDRQPGLVHRASLALIGKVFCKADASLAPIHAGDLLTTSALRGHAMRVTDDVKAFGAVIGKALQPLVSGQGLIPIVVTPH